MICKSKSALLFNTLIKFVIQARLGEDSKHYIDFDIYDRNGNFVKNVIETRVLTGVTPVDQLLSWGSAGYGDSAWGSGGSGSELSTMPYETTDVYIPEVWRIVIRLTSNDKLPASINFFIATILDRQEQLLLNNIETLEESEEVEIVISNYVDEFGNDYVDELANNYVDS